MLKLGRAMNSIYSYEDIDVIDCSVRCACSLTDNYYYVYSINIWCKGVYAFGNVCTPRLTLISIG